MPFYLKTAPRRPLWQPALWAGSALFVWTVVLRLFTRGSPAPRLGGLTQTFYALILTALGAALAAGFYWALGTPRVRGSIWLRLGSATLTAAVFLTMLTLAAGLGAPSGPWARVTRHEFVLSTAVLALVFGWFIAHDPLGLAKETVRVYLTPKDVAAMSEAERAGLRLDSQGSGEEETKSSA